MRQDFSTLSFGLGENQSQCVSCHKFGSLLTVCVLFWFVAHSC